jgi:FixJ family two-component response regulator
VLGARTYERSALPVVIVDADVGFREHMVSIVRAAGWHPYDFGSAEELLTDPHGMTPGCFLVDVDLPGLSGLELQQLLAKRVGVSVIFASARQDVRLTVRVLRAGAVNFLVKPVDRGTVVDSIREALDRSRSDLCREAEQCALRARLLRLSRRERQVMKLVIGGLMNKQVAAELGISEMTVKAHRRQVMFKMRAASLAELITIGSKLRITGIDAGQRAHSTGSAPIATASSF